jgi:putative phosphoesterase
LIGILSDAHGNAAAFDRAVEVLYSRGAERLVFLGDALGYLPSTAVLASIGGLGDSIQCIRGNHEDLLLRGRYDPDRDPIYQHRRIRALLTREDLDRLATWPTSLRLAVDAGTVLCVHGSPLDPTGGRVHEDTDLGGFDVAEQFVFVGHTHRPFIRATGTSMFVNVGSCGLPRDHGTLGCGALFNPMTGETQLIRFDIERETRTMLRQVPGVHASVLALLNRRPPSPAENRSVD